jgi:hypothetical protein
MTPSFAKWLIEITIRVSPLSATIERSISTGLLGSVGYYLRDRYRGFFLF